MGSWRAENASANNWARKATSSQEVATRRGRTLGPYEVEHVMTTLHHQDVGLDPRQKRETTRYQQEWTSGPQVIT